MQAAEALVQAHLAHLPVLPAAVHRLTRSFDDPNSHLKDLARDIAADAVLAGRVLRAANSAYFAPPQPLESIDQALRYLGFGQTRSLILAASLQRSTEGQTDLVPYWRRSLHAADYAKRIAGWLNAPSETAYLLGLVHDLGFLVLRAAKPRAIEKIQTDTDSRAGQLAEEHRVLGCSSLAVSAALLRLWAFPEMHWFTLDSDDCHCHQPTSNCPSLGPLGAAVHIGRSLAAGDAPLLGMDALEREGLTIDQVRETLSQVDTSTIQQLLTA